MGHARDPGNQSYPIPRCPFLSHYRLLQVFGGGRVNAAVSSTVTTGSVISLFYYIWHLLMLV